MHQAPDEPRLDDAWVQYYGGEKLGGIKKLTSIDDDSSDDGDVRDPAGTSERALISEAGRTFEAQNPPSTSSVPHLETPPITPQEDHPENRTHSTIAPIKDFRRKEKSRTAPSPPNSHVKEVEDGQSTVIRQTDDSKTVTLTELHTGDSRPSAVTDVAAPSFKSWSKRWSPWLKRGGSIKVCEAFFLMTHAQGKTDCFTSNSEIMKRTKLSRAQCIRNIHYLIEMGFLDELGEINNKEAKGTSAFSKLRSATSVLPGLRESMSL